MSVREKAEVAARLRAALDAVEAARRTVFDPERLTIWRHPALAARLDQLGDALHAELVALFTPSEEIK